MIYDSPLLSPQQNLEIAIGAIKFNEEVIKNLRKQIEHLRELTELKYDMQLIDSIQYKHLR